MRFSRVSAWASSGFIFAVWLGMASTGRAAEPPAFSVDPSTVTAGKTLLILCQSKKSLKDARIRVGKTEAPFYELKRRTWVARVGIAATESAGPRTALFFPTRSTESPTSEIPFFVRAGSYPISRITLKPEKDDLITSGAVERDGERLASFYTMPGSPKKMWEGSFLWPAAGIVSSEFGARRKYGTRAPTGSHSGVDLANSTGTPVNASAPGRVVLSERMESLGNVVMLDHGQGIYTYYLHMLSASARVGQTVNRGERIGLMGQEGIATGPHVHWSLTVAGVRVDPMEWADKAIP
jgi:murein DD-endopeptidase MepM/ murein hydrolase activator NlpD